MLVFIKSSVEQNQVNQIRDFLENSGCIVVQNRFPEYVVIKIQLESKNLDVERLKSLPGVKYVVPRKTVDGYFNREPFVLASREIKNEDTVISVGPHKIKAGNYVIMSGPPAIESEEHFFRMARAIKEAGADIIRACAYKPRTSPYTFHGMEREGVKLGGAVRKELNIPVIAELLDIRDCEIVQENCDIIEIGMRNMQNYALLKEAGKLGKPILLKRNMSATVDEWLLAAEYIMAQGCSEVILCERGIRSFDVQHSRYALDMGVFPVLRRLTHLPLAVDPSHGTGRPDCIASMAASALMAGAQMIMMDTHDAPEKALCDGKQCINLNQLGAIIKDIRILLNAYNQTSIVKNNPGSPEGMLVDDSRLKRAA